MNAFLKQSFSVENMLNYILLAHKSAFVPPKCACLLLHINTKILIYHLLFSSNFLGKPFGYSFVILVLSRAILSLT